MFRSRILMLVVMTAMVISCETPDNLEQVSATTVTPVVASVATESVQLTGEEITKAFTSNTFRGVDEGGVIYFIFYDADGKISGKWGISKDDGSWWTEKDLYCRKWTRWVNGETHCRMVFLEDGKITMREKKDVAAGDGGVLLEGNPKNL